MSATVDSAPSGCAGSSDRLAMEWNITGGRVLSDGRLEHGTLAMRDGLIGKGGTAAKTFDANGALVLPGIVDIHGDAFERIIMPRPAVSFDAEFALREADRQLIANGITTAYHGLTVSWEPGARSLEPGRAFRIALAKARHELRANALLHIRWETFALDVVEEVLNWLPSEPYVILAFNDHTTGIAKDATQPRKIRRMSERSGLSPEEFQDLLADVWSRRDEVPGMIESVAARAKANGAMLLAHDERSVEERHWFRSLGARASEFPLTRETAADARAHGEHVVLGAPNVMRGGSHVGALTASEAIADGLCTVLATDYYYPSPLAAAFKLARDGICDLPSAWALVSENPAATAGLDDRGQLVPGKRADILIVDDSNPFHPQLSAVFVGGKLVSADLSRGCAIH